MRAHILTGGHRHREELLIELFLIIEDSLSAGCSVGVPLAEVLVFVVVGRVGFPLIRHRTDAISSQRALGVDGISSNSRDLHFKSNFSNGVLLQH